MIIQMKNRELRRVLCCALVACAGALASAKEAVYISPNNDGIQDELTVPIGIEDKRYISEWQFIITDESGTPVRTIGNKETRPDRLTFKSFFQLLFRAKQGVQIPDSVTWNGVLDTGETAPDGRYFYYMTATDDNGNRAETGRFEVIVDNTPPEIELAQPAAEDRIFGEGAKQVFDIVQSGSVEDEWRGVIADAAGTVVREWNWRLSAPPAFSWDGTDNSGLQVADGVYSYSVSAADRAGNRSPAARITNIIYSAERPATNIIIAGSRYFSPNGDGVQDSIEFAVLIPQPEGANKLTRWSVDICDETGAVRRSFGGSGEAPQQLSFDGRDSGGSLLPDGQYQAVVSASYLNGYEPAVIRSPVFVLDNTPPAADVRLSENIFSPDGDGNKDTITVYQETSAETEWLGEIIDEASGAVVRRFAFGSLAPREFEWDGADDTGALSANGRYRYRIAAQDFAGNTASVLSDVFELDTGTTEVILTSSAQAFSPNGDGVRETAVFRSTIQSESGIANYRFVILNTNGDEVWTQSGSGRPPAEFEWDGRGADGAVCADGLYTAALTTAANNGSEAVSVSRPVMLDTVYPAAELTVPYLVFSPEGDGRKDTLPLTVSASEEDLWTMTAENDSGVVRSWMWQGAPESFEWDGSDEAGNTLADGTYRIVLASTDAAGNACTVHLDGIQIDCRETRAYFTVADTAVSPNGDGVRDTQEFRLSVSLNEGIESWRFSIKNERGDIVREWTQSASAAGEIRVPETIVWDGRNASGRAAEGMMIPELDITYVKGNRVAVSGSSFIASVTPPVLTVTTSPRYFSPDNDGVDDDLFISLNAESAVGLESWFFEIYDPQNGSVFWNTSGTTAVTERMVWDGRGNNGELVQSAMDYPFTFSVTDELGMTSSVEGIISVDVLVIRVGDVLKMQVPAIIFRADNADFKSRAEAPQNGLTQEQIDNNMRVLRRIADILNKFKDYSVSIEGHANNISGTEAEETSTANGNIPLVPLSQARAETVKTILVEFGVDASRLSTVGVGGRMPVVPRSDRDNWWKNRRVEFILEK